MKTEVEPTVIKGRKRKTNQRCEATLVTVMVERSWDFLVTIEV